MSVVPEPAATEARRGEARSGEAPRGDRHLHPRPGARDLSVHQRSVVLETVVRVVFHTVLVLGLYLLFAGHNQPGGGFVGGLVVGAAFTLRYVAGGRDELRSAVPVDPGLLLGLGLVTAAVTGVVPWLAGDQFLESAYVILHPPVLGEVKLTSALAFDIGVFLVVVGLALGVLRTLGAEAEK